MTPPAVLALALLLGACRSSTSPASTGEAAPAARTEPSSTAVPSTTAAPPPPSASAPPPPSASAPAPAPAPPTTEVAWQPRGARLAVIHGPSVTLVDPLHPTDGVRVGSDGHAELLDAFTGKALRPLEGALRAETEPQFSPDHRWIAQGGAAPAVWEIATGKRTGLVGEQPGHP